MSDMDVLRRIAERGLGLSQEEVEKGRLDPRGHLDLWNHMVDEIQRATLKYEPEPVQEETIELNLEDEQLLTLALEAHRRNITLNEYMMDILTEYIQTQGLTDEQHTPE